ncbi:hypothetical protein D3C76_1551430 [compost metagenome]
MFGAARWAPGRPDVQQHGFAIAQHRLVISFARLVEGFQLESRHRLADQCRFQHGRVFATGVARQLHHKRRHQQQEQD